MIPPQITLIVIRTTELELVVRFYQCLGIGYTAHRHGSGPSHFATDLNGVVFEIYPTNKTEDVDRTTRLGFHVCDLSGVMESLQSRAATVIEEPRQTEWGFRAVVRDPDGRSVELYSNEAAT